MGKKSIIQIVTYKMPIAREDKTVLIQLPTFFAQSARTDEDFKCKNTLLLWPRSLVHILIEKTAKRYTDAERERERTSHY